MSIIKLIGLGLWLTPFVFLPSGTREVKELCALSICLVLGLLIFYEGKFKKFSNKWALFLVGWFVVNIMQAPDFKTQLFGANASNFWVWKPFVFGMVYLLSVIGISSIKITSRHWTMILKGLIYPAFLMSLYIFIQAIGLDQWFGVKETAAGVTNPHLAGFMGQPTIVSPFIAMCVPFALYGRKYVIALSMILSVILTKSMIAIGALLITLLIFISLFRNKKLICVGIMSVVLSVGIAAFPQTRHAAWDKVVSESSGRFSMWPTIVDDWKSPVIGGKKIYPVTGIGAGSFHYVFSPRLKNNWRQAHNEYLEVLYNFGLVGLFFFIMAIFHVIKNSLPFALKFGGDRVLAVLASLLCICICAGGTFVWQIGTTAFYTVVLVGLLHNKEFIKGA